MRNAVRSPELSALCRHKAEMLIAPLRAVAIEHGYALTVHGSLERDIDLVAVPWTVGAVDQGAVVRAFVAEVRRVNGWANVADNVVDVDPYDFSKRCPEPKPHGRLGWSIHLGGGPYVDLSVMPPLSSPVERLRAALEANVREQQERQREYDARKAAGQ